MLPSDGGNTALYFSVLPGSRDVKARFSCSGFFILGLRFFPTFFSQKFHEIKKFPPFYGIGFHLLPSGQMDLFLRIKILNSQQCWGWHHSASHHSTEDAKYSSRLPVLVAHQLALKSDFVKY